jgi:C-terminal peptidase prc
MYETAIKPGQRFTAWEKAKRRTMRQRSIILFTALAILFGFTPCRSENKEFMKTFEIIWKKVNETYFDPTFAGLNWRDVYDRYQPQIAAAEKDEVFYDLINKMLWELNVSHTYLIPPKSFALYEPLVFAEGSAGIDIRIIDGEAVITAVKPESPADKAGLCPGYVIQAIDGISVEKILQEAESLLLPPYNSRSRIARVTKAILGRIYGTPEAEVSITYSDEEGEKSKKIKRVKRSGAAVGPKGMFFLAVEFEARRLDNGIGYIRLNTFQPPLIAQISKAIKSMGKVTGIIFDLRGNSGGEIEGMPDLFLAERALLYSRRTRDSDTKVFFDPADNVYKGPLVLLIDMLSGSASEIFAACMQAIGRAVVIGERSPGGVLESDVMIFPNGTIFMYPVAQISTPEGTVLEGYGVVPDIEVGLDRELLLKGIDSQLDSAIKYIKRGIFNRGN